MNKTELIGVILLGGYSKRLGTDKGNMDIHGTPQYKHLYSFLSSHVSRVVYSGRPEQQWTLKIKGDQFVSDIIIDQGPLGGILSALKKYNKPIIVIPCDLPFIPSNLISEIKSTFNKKQDLIVSRDFASDRLQPLVGIWNNTLIDNIERYLDYGHRSVSSFLMSVDFEVIDAPSPRSMFNVNTCQDLDLAKLLAIDIV